MSGCSTCKKDDIEPDNECRDCIRAAAWKDGVRAAIAQIVKERDKWAPGDPHRQQCKKTVRTLVTVLDRGPEPT